MTGISESAKAFRNSMEGLVRENSASVRSVEQSWTDSAKAADKSAQEASEKGQKLLARVRERAEYLRRADEKSGVKEISVGEEPEVEDPDPEVERFSQQLYASQKRKVEETAATTATAQAAQAQLPSDAYTAPAQQAPPQENAWNVQAGRFGRRNEQPAPPPVAPQPPAPPKPAPRRQQPAFDDDEDFENQSWLR
ncbi:hypothetical protein EIL87_24950 [Saccharopolyspora rhizosphaerae]|uniref:Uncharacterized protein n=1 Tax=Saccharopolyspora rhizosphaerae TaxID=2492662 RepID=A0A3R8NTI6_9PSEU|nr:hypothetical protein [Saccharopolyspora rhizosphaerae]RRO12920.1 hypothetical protein EIL87_24950 [Saccharopolyspora rhizosphaerae]